MDRRKEKIRKFAKNTNNKLLLKRRLAPLLITLFFLSFKGLYAQEKVNKPTTPLEIKCVQYPKNNFTLQVTKVSTKDLSYEAYYLLINIDTVLDTLLKTPQHLYYELKGHKYENKFYKNQKGKNQQFTTYFFHAAQQAIKSWIQNPIPILSVLFSGGQTLDFIISDIHLMAKQITPLLTPNKFQKQTP